jgi:hypothetical protein
MPPVGIPLPGVDYPLNPADFSAHNRIATGGGVVANIGPHTDQFQQAWSSPSLVSTPAAIQVPDFSTLGISGRRSSSSGGSQRTRSSAGSQQTRSSLPSSRGRSTNRPHPPPLAGQIVHNINVDIYTHVKFWEKLLGLGNSQVIWDYFPSFSQAQLDEIFRIAKRDCDNNLVGVPQGTLRLSLHSKIVAHFFASPFTSHGFSD